MLIFVTLSIFIETHIHIHTRENEHLPNPIDTFLYELYMNSKIESNNHLTPTHKLTKTILPIKTKTNYKVDLPEIKGNHRKFRTLVTSYIGNQIEFLN